MNALLEYPEISQILSNSGLANTTTTPPVTAFQGTHQPMSSHQHEPQRNAPANTPNLRPSATLYATKLEPQQPKAMLVTPGPVKSGEKMGAAPSRSAARNQTIGVGSNLNVNVSPHIITMPIKGPKVMSLPTTPPQVVMSPKVLTVNKQQLEQINKSREIQVRKAY